MIIDPQHTLFVFNFIFITFLTHTFLPIFTQKDSKKKVSFGWSMSIVQNQIKALVSFCTTTFSFVGEKKPTLFEYKKVARR